MRSLVICWLSDKIRAIKYTKDNTGVIKFVKLHQHDQFCLDSLTEWSQGNRVKGEEASQGHGSFGQVHSGNNKNLYFCLTTQCCLLSRKHVGRIQDICKVLLSHFSNTFSQGQQITTRIIESIFGTLPWLFSRISWAWPIVLLYGIPEVLHSPSFSLSLWTAALTNTRGPAAIAPPWDSKKIWLSFTVVWLIN